MPFIRARSGYKLPSELKELFGVQLGYGEAVMEAVQKLLSLESVNDLRKTLRHVNTSNAAVDVRWALPCNIIFNWVPGEVDEDCWDECCAAVVKEKLGYAGLLLQSVHIEPRRLLHGLEDLDVGTTEVSQYLEGVLVGKAEKVRFVIEKYETKGALEQCNETLEQLLMKQK